MATYKIIVSPQALNHVKGVLRREAHELLACGDSGLEYVNEMARALRLAKRLDKGGDV